jgi:predicted regulator of Ras-like GTPase activity (Roadblock/LC7/MglB family)
MYKLSRRKNLIPFGVLLAVGAGACMFVPPMFNDKLLDVPAFALFPAEIALVMMLSVLVFENATPVELLKLAFTMLAMTMFLGGMGNVWGKSSQTLPDQTLLLNWVQLICMNVGGLIATVALYQTRAGASEQNVSVRPTAIREVARDEDDDDEEDDEEELVAAANGPKPASGESVEDIISKLDISRIMRLEKAITKPNSSNMSLDSLFAEESQAAAKSSTADVSASGGLDNLLGGGTGSGTAVKAPPALDEPKAGWATNDIETEAVPAVEPDWSTADSAIPTPTSTPAIDEGGKDEEKEDLPVGEPPSEDAAAAKADGARLFDDMSLGGDLEDLFADLAQGASNDDLTAEKLAEVRASAPTVEDVVEETKPADQKLMDVSDDDIDDIFANIVGEEEEKDQVADFLDDVAQAPAAKEEPKAPDVVAPSTGTQTTGPKEVKEFGRLSVGATSKIEPAAPGTLKTIGQMLLDTQAVENLIRNAEVKGDTAPGAKITSATAKVVSAARGADIQSMLDKIAEHELIDGCLVIGKDGLLIGATQSLGMMRDVYGVLALGIHSTTNLGTKKIDMGELRQSIFRGGDKFSILTEIGIGMLAAFGDKWDLYRIDGVLDHIGKCVKESQASGGAELPMETLSGGLLAEEPQAAVKVEAPPVVAEEPAEERETVVAISDMKGGLLSVGDDDLGDLFDNVLADPKVQHDAIGDKPAAAPSDDMEDLFDDLLDKAKDVIEDPMDFTPAESAKSEEPVAKEEPKKEEPKQEEPPVAPAKPPEKSKPAAKEAQQMKEFGRLSSNSSAASTDNQGAIKAIGRQLIDVQAVENIIKSGEKREKMGHGLTTARVISQARGEGIKALLTKIDCCPGVAGSLIVGNDGLVIASTLQGGLDKDLLGALCNAMHSHTDLGVRELHLGKTRQVIFHAENKMTVLTAVAVGVLAVFVENHDLGQIDSLLTAIDSTVRG